MEVEMKVRIVLAALALCVPLTPAQAVADQVRYICRIADKPPVTLDISRHRYQMAGRSGVLNEGLNFGFKTPLGYSITLDLGDPDRLHFQQPSRVTGRATVEKDGRQTPTVPVACRLLRR
jgi:hypothetical protein